MTTTTLVHVRGESTTANKDACIFAFNFDYYENIDSLLSSGTELCVVHEYSKVK